MNALLEVHAVTQQFGGVTALARVNLTVNRGTITGLIGPNGAGKTTLFNVICGVRPPTSGSVRFDGIEVNNTGVHERSAMGISRTFQRLELFWTLTVYENVLVAAELASHPNPAEIARQNLELLGIDHLADATAGELSTGSARLLEVARALATSPKLLLLDEPVAGMTDGETERTAELLLELAGQHSIMVVEHDMAFIRQIADVVTVLCDGAVLAQGSFDDVQANERVIEVYLGR